MRYLVTGAQGFAGRFLCAELLRADPSAIVVGSGRSGRRDATFNHEVTWGRQRFAAPLTADLMAYDADRYRYIACELSAGRSLDDLIRDAEPDVVIHLAAALRDDPAEVLIRSNVSGTAALVGALARLGKKPLLILGSSGSIYGAPQSLPLAENLRCAPHEPYAMSKLAAELVAGVLSQEARIPMMIVRIFNIAGPGQEERHVCGRFAAQAAAIVHGNLPPMLEIGDLRPTRDFIDVRDVARAIVALAQNGRPGEVYNVASGVENSIADILNLVLRAANLYDRVAITERYTRTADVSRAYADIGKLRSCGFRIAFPLEDTIADVFDYYMNDVSRIAATGATTSATSSPLTSIPSSHG